MPPPRPLPREPDRIRPQVILGSALCGSGRSAIQLRSWRTESAGSRRRRPGGEFLPTPILARGVSQGRPDQMDHGRLHDRLREHRVDAVRQTLEPVAERRTTRRPPVLQVRSTPTVSQPWRGVPASGMRVGQAGAHLACNFERWTYGGSPQFPGVRFGRRTDRAAIKPNRSGRARSPTWDAGPVGQAGGGRAARGCRGRCASGRYTRYSRRSQ